MRSSPRWPPGALLLGALLVSGGAARAVPDHLRCLQGIARYQAGDLPAAISGLGRCPASSASARHYLGLALMRSGKLGEGRRVLAAAARRQASEGSESPRLLLDLGLAYLSEGNAVWAVRTLSRARDLAPQDSRIRYYLGVARIRTGAAGEAVAELERSRELSLAEAPSIRLQLGLALYQSRRFEESRRELSPLLRGPQGKVARHLLRAAYQAEGIPAALVSAELHLGAAVDTNPLYEHETTAPTALGPTIGGSLVLRPWIDAHNLIWGELAGSRTFLFGAGEASPDKEPNQASPTELRASAFYLRRLSLRGRTFHLGGGYAFGVTFLDGEPPLADDNHIFLEEHGGHLLLQRLEGGLATTRFRFSFGRLQFAELARSHWSTELSLEHVLSLWDRVRLLGWLSYRHEAANADDYRASIPGLGLGGAVRGPLDLVLGLRLGYEYRDHPDSLGGRWNDPRMDHNLDFTVEVGRSLPWDLRLRAVYRRLQNFSSVATFDYGRDLVTLILSWSIS